MELKQIIFLCLVILLIVVLIIVFYKFYSIRKDKERNLIIDKALEIIIFYKKHPDEKNSYLVREYLEKLTNQDLSDYMPVNRGQGFVERVERRRMYSNHVKSNDYLFNFFLENEIRHFCDNKENYQLTKDFTEEFKNLPTQRDRLRSKTSSTEK